MRTGIKYIPCFKCAMRGGCSALKGLTRARAKFASGHKSASITCMRIRCEKYENQFQPGQRVKFSVRDHEFDSTVVATGTVMKYSPHNTKFVIWVDEKSLDDGVNHSIISLDPKRMQALPELEVEICPECGKPYWNGNDHEDDSDRLL